MRLRIVLGSALVLGVLLLVYGVTGFNWGEGAKPDSSQERYNNLVREYTTLYPRFYTGETSTMEERELIVRGQRDNNIKVWQEFIETTEDDRFLANSLFYLGINQYANAGDFGELKSAEEAIAALSGSLMLAPGDAHVGYSEIEWGKRLFLEAAINLKQDIEEEEEKKKQEQQKQDQESQTLVPVPLPEENEGSGGGGPDDLPVLEPGVRP